jgi:putative SOS response-associated peptidase YedK
MVLLRRLWDVAPIHDRQMVILERSDWSAWLEHTGNESIWWPLSRFAKVREK